MKAVEPDSHAMSSVVGMKDTERQTPLLVSVGEAAVALGISRTTTYQMLREGRFPVRVIQIGGRYRVPRRDLERFIEGGEQPSERER